MGAQAATQKNGKKRSLAQGGPTRAAAIQDNTNGAKKIEKRRAPNAEKQSTRAPEPKFERKTPNENARFPQVLENKAFEHQKWPKKNH